MAQNDGTLVAEKRGKLGTAENRRLRKRGITPGNLYGHGKGSVSISVPTDALDAMVHAGTKVVDLDVAGEKEKTMFREVQWDTFGITIQHFDLIRIDADERVVVEVNIEIRGISPGVQGGGVLDAQLRTFTVECLAIEIPASIPVRIGELEIEQSIHVSDVEFPPGVNVQNPPEAVVVHIAPPVVEEEDEEGEGELGPAEPEVIGRKAESEESGEDQ